MLINRTWCIPDRYTFRMQPVKELLFKYVKDPDKWIDPFAGYYSPAGTRNDLNKNTNAQYNMYAAEFLEEMLRRNNKYNGCLFDPPYSLRQVKECYNSIGIEKLKHSETQKRWNPEKEMIMKLLNRNGIFIHFGWNSNGLGKVNGFEIIEILLIAHGGYHNDTIVIVEKKTNDNLELFE